MRPHLMTLPTITLLTTTLSTIVATCTATLFGAGQIRTKENLDLPYDALGDMATEEEAPEVVVFYNQSYEGDGFFYCLDRSSSTCDGDIEIEKRETINNISEFSPRVHYGVVFYDQGLMKFPSSGRPMKATPSGKSAGISFVSSVGCGRDTCVQKGLLASIELANFSPAKRNVIIYLGDGGTTCPGADPHAYAQHTLRMVKARNVKRFAIHSTHVGGGDTSFSKALAQQNGGQCRPPDLPR